MTSTKTRVLIETTDLKYAGELVVCVLRGLAHGICCETSDLDPDADISPVPIIVGSSLYGLLQKMPEVGPSGLLWGAPLVNSGENNLTARVVSRLGNESGVTFSLAETDINGKLLQDVPK